MLGEEDLNFSNKLSRTDSGIKGRGTVRNFCNTVGQQCSDLVPSSVNGFTRFIIE